MKTIGVLLISFALCLGFTSQSYALFDDLSEEIQKELDGNPFLKKQGIKLRVTDEENGYVSIEMYEGNRTLRNRIDSGTDILTGQIEQQWFLGSSSKEEKESVKILRRSLGVIKSMEGVKEIMLTAAVNTPSDKLDDLVSNAEKLYNKNEYTRALELYEQAASQGYPDAQKQIENIKNILSGEKNSYTIAEIFSKAAELKGQTIVIKGKVVKVSPNIMGHTWIHLQDGTGNPTESTHDIIVILSKSTLPPPKAAIITIEGTLSVDKDFGSGYVYSRIIENAAVLP